MANKTNQNPAPKTAPVHKFKIWPLSAAIWERQHDGETFFNVTFERSYKDKEGKYQSSGSMGRDDLLVLAKLADAAHTWIVQREDQIRAEETR